MLFADPAVVTEAARHHRGVYRRVSAAWLFVVIEDRAAENVVNSGMPAPPQVAIFCQCVEIAPDRRLFRVALASRCGRFSHQIHDNRDICLVVVTVFRFGWHNGQVIRYEGVDYLPPRRQKRAVKRCATHLNFMVHWNRHATLGREESGTRGKFRRPLAANRHPDRRHPDARARAASRRWRRSFDMCESCGRSASQETIQWLREKRLRSIAPGGRLLFSGSVVACTLPIVPEAVVVTKCSMLTTTPSRAIVTSMWPVSTWRQVQEIASLPEHHASPKRAVFKRRLSSQSDHQ